MRAAVLLAVLALTASLQAAEIEAGGQQVTMMANGDTGALEIDTSGGFGAHAEVFWSDRVSTRASATFLNPAAILFPENPPPDDVDLGTLGLDIYAVSARLHLRPRSRFSMFVGGGAALVDIGNLDDQFGEAVEVEFDPEMTFLAETGVRYRVLPRVTIELSATYLPLEAEGNVRVATDPRVLPPSTLALDPLLISAGAAWRF